MFSIALFLDFDGTLATIAPTPSQAHMPTATRQLIRILVGMPGMYVAIVSGRELDDIKHKVDLKSVYYVGNHGMRIEGPKVKHQVQFDPMYRAILVMVKRHIQEISCLFPGVFVEDKQTGISIHYRHVEVSKVKELKAMLRVLVSEPLRQQRVKLLSGKKVFDIVPSYGWDKGTAVTWLLSLFSRNGSKPILPIFIGDDITDESAFRAFKDIGVTIRVGRAKKTAAQWRLQDTGNVVAFLEMIRAVKEVSK